MFKQLIFGKNKSKDHDIGVWVGLIFGIIAGIFLLFGLWPFALLIIAVLLFFGVLDRFYVDGYDWVDDYVGFSRGVAIGTPLGAAFAAFFKDMFFPWYWHAFAVVILMEIIFLFDNQKPKKDLSNGLIKFTAKRNLVCLIDSIIIYFGMSGALNILNQVDNADLSAFFPEILKWIKFVSTGILVVLAIWFIIYLNSYKYRGGNNKKL